MNKMLRASLVCFVIAAMLGGCLMREAFAIQTYGAEIPWAALHFVNASGGALPSGKLCSYVNGTTTPQDTYVTSDLTGTKNANPIIMDSSGRPTTNGIYLIAAKYTMVLKTAGTTTDCTTGATVWTANDVFDLGQLLAAGLVSFTSINNKQYCTTGTTAGAKITAALALLPSTGGVVDCTNLQGAQTISSTLTIDKPVDLLLGGATFAATASISITSNNVRILGVGASVGSGTAVPATSIQWSSMGAATIGPYGGGTAGINIAANNVSLENLALRGPAAGVYVGNEVMVLAQGTSTTSRRGGLQLRNVEIYNVGSDGIFTYFFDEGRIENSYIHNIGYAGGRFVSSNHWWIGNNRIQTITPGTSSDMYGLAFTHYSTGYNVAAGAGTKNTANPFCWDITITNNHVENVLSTGIDAHGCYECVVSGNKVYAVAKGIAIAGGSGDATAYAGGDNVISNNVVDANYSTGALSGLENTASPIASAGIELGSPTVVLHQRVVVSGNVIRNFGVVSSTPSGAIRAYGVAYSTISGNVIDRWGGVGIAVDANSSNVSDNVILRLADPADTAGYAIATTSTTGALSVIANTVSAGGGTAARIGFWYGQGGSTLLPVLTGNDFTAATASQLTQVTTGALRGADYTNEIAISGAGTSINVSNCTPGTGCLVLISSTSGTTFTAITGGGADGMFVTFYVVSATTVTFSRAGIPLKSNGSADVVLDQYDCVTFQKQATTWIEVSRSGNNG